MSNERNHTRALRYRKLALAEADKYNANLLNQLADEAERGVLCTAHLRSGGVTPSANTARTETVLRAP
jgi:hypothetical protein